jgi:hypothetical protein
VEPEDETTLTLRQVLGPDEVLSATRGTFDVEFARRDARWVPDVVSHAEAARRAVSREMRDLFLVRIRLIIAPTRDDFLRLVGQWAENSVAVAAPGPTFVINADVLRTGSREVLNTTLIHEMSHAYVGVRCLKRLPRWLDEGIAMSVARETSIEDSSAVFVGNVFNRLIPLRELEFQFPVEAERQRLAYRQSWSVVSFVSRTTAGGQVSDLVATLVGEAGVAQIERYWNPVFRNALEARWRESLQSRLNWTLIGFSSGMFWFLIAILFLVAWGIRRRRSIRQHAEWDQEEGIYEEVDREEERVWGSGVDEEDDDDEDEDEDDGDYDDYEEDDDEYDDYEPESDDEDDERDVSPRR